MSHYFINDNLLKDQEYQFKTIIDNHEFLLKTNSGIFSKKKVDLGTKLLLENITFNNPQSILDVGVGYGIISIFCAKANPKAKITGVDVNIKALKYARINALNNKVNNVYFKESNFFENIIEKFDLIISNPPFRIGKEKLYNFYKQVKEHLNPNGEFIIVAAKNKGAMSTFTYLKELFQDTEITLKKKGYVVIKCK